MNHLTSFPRRRRLARGMLAGLVALAVPVASLADVTITVDATTTHQTLVGYGATTISLIFDRTDDVPPALRAQAIDAVYNQVKLNMGNLEVGPFESPSSAVYSPANDDNDPNTFNASGFNWIQSDNLINGVVRPGQAFGLDSFYLGPAISETFEFAWARNLRGADYQRYLDECAEHVAALAIHWRDAYGITPPLMQLWNEPLSGNTELSGGSRQEMADIVARAGARLRREGFDSMRFVIPAEETEQLSLDEATAILSDANARQYVGAIAYHPYPYGSTYASVPNILATSGSGQPDSSKIAVRNALRDLGAQYGVPVFMVEVSHSESDFGNFDGARGRAIHIHDEMLYANASAYFGMNAMWDSVTNDAHYQGRTNPGLFAEDDGIVLIDDAAGQVYLTEMARAIGHYARWAPRGSVRLEAQSSDPLVQVTAFRVDSTGRLVLVVINNETTAQTIRVAVSGLSLDASGAVAGEQSTAAAYWAPMTGAAPSASGYTLSVPARSITSLGAPIAGATQPDDGGVVTADAGGTRDSGAGTDAGSAMDTGVGRDATSGVDSGGARDAGSAVDARVADASGVDGAAAGDGSPSADGGTGTQPGGCACRAGTARKSERSALAWLAIAALALAARRRRGAHGAIGV